jgi:hypothetical protein
MSRSRIAMCLVALGLLGGCTGGGGNNVDNVKTVPRTEAMTIARDYAERVVTVTGGELGAADREPHTAPCEGRRGELSETIYYAFFNFNIAPIPAERQLPTLQRLREHWQQQGYTIKRERELSGGSRGEVAVENPADEYEIRVISTEPPTAFAVRVSSPCYQSNEPR